MTTISIDCDLCGNAVRTGMCVPHQDSGGLDLLERTFCMDCWVRWKNIRQNLDGTNEYGVQCMTCPHCHKPFTEEAEIVYLSVRPRLYDVLVDGTHPFQLTIDTTLINFKRSILWSTMTVPYTCIEEFDLAVDDVVIDSHFVCTAAGTTIRVIPRRKKNILLYIYPAVDIVVIEVYETSLFRTFKIQRGIHANQVLFDIQTGLECIDSRTIHSYANICDIGVMPRHLYDAIALSPVVSSGSNVFHRN
jgi:hypothetical protein